MFHHIFYYPFQLHPLYNLNQIYENVRFDGKIILNNDFISEHLRITPTMYIEQLCLILIKKSITFQSQSLNETFKFNSEFIHR